jgi:hypothetical protein
VSPWLSNEPEGRNDRQPDDLRPARRACGLGHAVPPWVATRTGFNVPPRRRGPQARQERGQADESNARRAPCGLAAPLPRGGHDQDESSARAVRGYAGGRRRVQRRDPRRVQRRGRPPRPRWHLARTGRAAELASEAARAEGASPPCHRPWPARRVPGRPSSTNGLHASTCAPAGAGHSPLTAGHRAPPAPRAFRRAGWPVSEGRVAPSPRPLPHDQSLPFFRSALALLTSPTWEG